MWVRIRSWHRIAFFSRRNQPKTRCGRWVPDHTADIVSELPMDAKSCEQCLRLLAHDQERNG